VYVCVSVFVCMCVCICVFVHMSLCGCVDSFTFNRGFKQFQQNIHKSSPKFRETNSNCQISAGDMFCAL
jgi:hypothetical protein